MNRYRVVIVASLVLAGILFTASIIFAWWHEPIEELTYLHGKTETEVLDILGNPDSSFQWVLQQGVTLPEMYVEVHNTYPPDDPASDGVVIRVLEWDGLGHRKAVFLHQVRGQWVVLESVRWKDGVAF